MFQSAHQLLHRFSVPAAWQLRLARVILLILIVALAFAVARLFWSVLAGPRPINLEPQPMATQASTVESKLLSFMNGPVVRAARLPADMQLIGVFLSSDPARSSAVFRSAGKTMRVGVGQTIGNTEFSVGQVEWGRAEVLSRTGASSWLELTQKRMELNQPRTSTQSSSNSRASAARGVSSLQERFAAARSARATTRQPQSNPGMAKIQEELLRFKQSPAEYLNQMGVVQSGTGLEITSQVSAQVRQQLGLMEGDQIISVNSQPAAEVLSDSAAIERIEMAGQARVQILRGEQRITLNPRF